MKSEGNRSPLAPAILVAIGILLLGGSAIIFFVPGLSSSSATQQRRGTMIPYPQIKRVSLKDAKAAFDKQSAIFIDVRGEPYFSQGHITGALSLPERDIMDHLNELDPRAWIITYCT